MPKWKGKIYKLRMHIIPLVITFSTVLQLQAVENLVESVENHFYQAEFEIFQEKIFIHWD